MGAATEWPSCLEHPVGGQANCFATDDENYAPYPDTGSYDTAYAVAIHTIGFDNPDRPHGNCNNWKKNGVSTSGAIDNAWTNMSLVPPPYHQNPETFVYGFLCSGPNFDQDGNDT